MNTTTKPLVTYLRRYRLRTGFSHDDLAFLVGAMYGGTISKYERAARSPQLSKVLALEILLSAPIRDIYEGLYREVCEEVHRRARGLARHIYKKPLSIRNERKLQTLGRILTELGPRQLV